MLLEGGEGRGGEGKQSKEEEEKKEKEKKKSGVLFGFQITLLVAFDVLRHYSACSGGQKKKNNRVQLLL